MNIAVIYSSPHSKQIVKLCRFTWKFIWQILLENKFDHPPQLAVSIEIYCQTKKSFRMAKVTI